MKSIKTLILAVLLLAFALPALAQIGGNTQPVFSYVGPTQMFSQHGTNEATGYTNSLVYVDVSKSLNVGLSWQLTGYSANASNVVYLVVFPATSASKRATTAAARISATPSTTEQVIVTNIQPRSPYIAVQMESVAAVSGTPTTNVVVNAWNTPP